MLLASLDSSNLSEQYIEKMSHWIRPEIAAQQIREAIEQRNDPRLSDPDYEPDAYIRDVIVKGNDAYIAEVFRNSAGGYGGSRNTESHAYYTAENDEDRAVLAELMQLA